MPPNPVVHDYVNRGLISHLDWNAPMPADLLCRRVGREWVLEPLTTDGRRFICSYEPMGELIRVDSRSVYTLLDEVFDEGLRVV